MMWRGRVLTRRDDREVDHVVAFGDEPRGDVGADGSFGATDERDVARVQLRGHPIGGGTSGRPQTDYACRINDGGTLLRN